MTGETQRTENNHEQRSTENKRRQQFEGECKELWRKIRGDTIEIRVEGGSECCNDRKKPSSMRKVENIRVQGLNFVPLLIVLFF